MFEVDEYGNWSAGNVPNAGSGTATFDVVAEPPGGGGGAGGGGGGSGGSGGSSGGGAAVGGSVQIEREARLVITFHRASQNQWVQTSLGGGSWEAEKVYQASWWAAPEQSRPEDYHEAGSLTQRYENDAAWDQRIYTWSGNTRAVAGSSSYGPPWQDADFADPLGEIRSVPEQSAREVTSGGVRPSYVRHFATKGTVRHPFFVLDGLAESSVTAATEYTLYTGGKAGVGRKNLFCLTVVAEEHLTPLTFPWEYTPIKPVTPKSRITALGRAAGADGRIYVVLPDNASVPVNLFLPDAKHYFAEVAATKHRLKILRGADITDTTNSVFAGEKIELLCKLIPETGAPVITNFSWTIPGLAISNYVADVNQGKVYTFFAKTNAGIQFYWVDEGLRLVRCKVKIEGEEISADTTFEVTRPNATLSASVEGEIRADAAYLGGSGQFLHFGGYQSGTNLVPGIRFQIHENNDTNGSYFFVQTGTLNRTALTMTGINRVGVAGPGLDIPHNVATHNYPMDSSQGPNATSDSPGQNLPVVYQFAECNDAFSMYLMFKHASLDSIEIPLQKIDWNWAASARQTSVSLNSWTVESASPPSNLNPVSTSAHPQWETNTWIIHWSP